MNNDVLQKTGNLGKDVANGELKSMIAIQVERWRDKSSSC